MSETDNHSTALEGVGVNQPDVSPSLEVRVRAITSGSQAYDIAKNLEDNSRSRNDIAAMVEKKYNGGQPHNQGDLLSNGEGWRNNFPTGFMSGIVDRITPEPNQVVEAARYLTSAQLDEDDPEAAKKTEAFRENVTKAIRRWNRWKSFNYSLWSEDVKHGCAIVACLDPYSPWPKLFRTDEAFLPEGTGQHADNIQVIAFKEDLLIHEFLRPLKDKQAAEDAGWDTEAAIDAANDALPQSQVTEDGGMAAARKYEDTIREGNVGASHSGAKVIEMYHVLAVEPEDEKVTRYTVNRRDKHELLFQHDDLYEKMEDVVTLFTLQSGNGKFYGSKGIGRILLNTHIAIERARNAMFDQLYISGLLILKTDATKTPQVQLKVRHPFVLVTSDADFAEQKIQGNIESYIEADQQLSRWAEQSVGAYISGLTDQTDPTKGKTATESSIEANRDNQAKVAFLARAWGQFADMIGMITRRLCDPETEDKIAKELQKDLKEAGLSKEEIQELANAPAAEVVQDMTSSKNQSIIAAFQVLRGDPSIDQPRLMSRYISALVDPQFAADIQLDEQGVQANEIEAVRQQIGENEDILNGASVPVSPRDMHIFHLKYGLSDLKNGLGGMLQAAKSNPAILDHLNAAMVHFNAHIQALEQQKVKPEVVAPFKQAMKQLGQVVMKFAEQMKSGAAQPPGAPQMSPNGPSGSAPQAGPQDAPPPFEEHLLKITSSIAYKDAPDDIKRQIEAAAGFEPSHMGAEANSTLTKANLQHVEQVKHDAQQAGPTPKVPSAMPMPQSQSQGPAPAAPVVNIPPPSPDPMQPQEVVPNT